MNLRTKLAQLILISSVLLLPAGAIAQTPTADLDKSIDLSVGSHVKVQQLLTNLQRAVAQHNPAVVAALVHYPIKVNPGKRPITIKSPKAFIKDYDRIITSDISTVILKQRYEALFVNSQGVMLGDGEVWITGFCQDKNCRSSDIRIGTIQDTTNLKP
jgi:hypothetical protein